MKICRSCQTLLILILMLRIALQRQSNRSLDSEEDGEECNCYDSCNSCSNHSDCTYLLGVCSSASSSTVASDSYNYSTESIYCSSYSSTGSLNLDDSKSTQVKLYQLSSVDILQHPTCLWSFNNTYSNKIYIKIKRDASNYEDIYMYVKYSNDSIKTYANSELSSCNQSSFDMTLSTVSFVSIKAKRLNSKSSYQININQIINSDSQNLNKIIHVLSFIIIVAIVLIVACIIKCKLRKKPPQPVGTPEQQEKLKYIIRTLKNMRAGKYSQFRLRFSQDVCVVCFDKFTNDSDVCITNECDHVFHSKCIEQWYCNIRCDGSLICPHCMVINTPFSRPLQSGEFPSESSFHLEMPG